MKRGQVSIFIILGLVLLLTVGTITTLYLQSTSESVEELSRDALASSVPTDLLPFYRYVEACVDSTLDTAIRLAGAKGGIIYPDEAGLTYNPEFQTESDGVTLFSSGSFGVAYWNYIYGTNNCESGCQKFVGHIPLVGDQPGSIESQLELYVERNLPKCVGDATRLEDIGVYYQIRGDPVVDVSIAEFDVAAKVNYPLYVEREGQGIVIPTVLGQNDIPLMQYYNDALFMTVLLNEYSALEEATVQWISVYSGMDPNKLPPMAGSTSDPSVFPFWLLFDVKDDLRGILEKHVPMFTVLNSKNFNPIVTRDDEFVSIKDELYRMFEIPGPDYFSKYNVFFQYGGQEEPFVRLNDDDYFIMPESLHLDFFPWFSITRVRTTYDVSYPVVISLENSDDDYEFSFAYEVNVRNNAPMNASYRPFDYSAQQEFVGDETYLCEPSQRTSKDVKFTLVDGITGEPEQGVTMLYHCGEETCAIGKTNETGTFDGPLPVCLNAQISFIKAGSERLALQVSPNIDFPQSFGDINIEPYREKTVTVRDVLTDVRTEEIREVSNMRRGSQAIIQLTRLKNQPSYPDYLITDEWPAYAIVDFNNPTATMTLLPGRYEGQIIGFVDQPFYIHPDRRCKSKGDRKECAYLPQETLEIETFMTGGMQFSESHGYFDVSKDDLDGSAIVEFRQLFQDIYAIPEADRKMEDMSAMGAADSLLVRHRTALQPVFK